MSLNRYYILPLLLLCFFNNSSSIDQNSIHSSFQKYQYLETARSDGEGDGIVEHRRSLSSLTIVNKRCAKFYLMCQSVLDDTEIIRFTGYPWNDKTHPFSFIFYSLRSRATFS